MLWDIHSHHPAVASDVLMRLQSLTLQDVGKLSEGGYYTVGIHPWYAAAINIDSLPECLQSPNVLALGECGLDRLCSDISWEEQIRLLEMQVQWSEQYCKPIVLHVVKTYAEIIMLHKRVQPKTPWIIHGFRGGEKLCHQLLMHGFYLSFGERYHPTAARAAYEANRLFIETDTSECSIDQLYSRMSECLDCSEEELEQQIDHQAQTVFFYQTIKNVSSI